MKHKLIAIVGPTASGKTRLSVELAKELGGEIISFDSMQIYRGMDIGTAKPTMEERQGIVHHMLDIADPREDYSVSRFVEEADKLLQELLSQGKTVILVGGTGLYIESLMKGLEFAPLPESGVRQELTRIAQEQGIEVLMDRLRAVDPESAERIHPSNQKRVIRALEIYLESGKTMTQHNLETQQRPPKYEPLWIGLDYVNREALYARINRRVDLMVEQGAFGGITETSCPRHSGKCHLHAGHRLQGAYGLYQRRVFLRGSQRAPQAVLPSLCQTAKNLVPPQSKDPLVPVGGRTQL